MVDDQLSTRLEDSIKKSFRSYNVEFKKKAKDERNRYIDLVKKSLKEIIKDEVMNQLPEILLKEVSNYSTHRDREDKDKDEDPPAGSESVEKAKYEKIQNLTQEHLVRPAFNLLKGTCKSRVELEYHFEECYKAITDRLDWTNLEGHEYPFDLSKPLPIIEDQVRQVVPANYFINNDLEYVKVTHVKVMKWYDYIYLEEIIIRREDQQLYKFKECDFSRLNLRDIEDLLLLLVQKKISNKKKYVIFDLNVTLQMFTRRVVILKRVEDLQLGVKSNQKKLNITRPETFRSNITKMTPYTTYNNLKGIRYQDKFKRNRMMSPDELYKFCDGTLTSVRQVLYDIASSLEMDYLPKKMR
nr:hypothetical protein [Tanacetum cinerariifolium]